MIEFAKETLSLLPFLFVTYLVLEAVEAHSGSALERWLERAKSVGPLAGSVAGAIPQCGVSAAAASVSAAALRLMAWPRASRLSMPAVDTASHCWSSSS